MKIAVLNYDNGSVDIINVENDFIKINYHEDVEEFLYSWCDYDTDNIEWIADEKLKINNGKTLDDFPGDDDIKMNSDEIY